MRRIKKATLGKGQSNQQGSTNFNTTNGPKKTKHQNRPGNQKKAQKKSKQQTKEETNSASIKPDHPGHKKDNTTLRIMTWNIQGKLDTHLSDPQVHTIINKHDIVVLTETKSQLREFDYYGHEAFNFAHIKGTRGTGANETNPNINETRLTGGTCIMIKKELMHACTTPPKRITNEHAGSTLHVRLNLQAINPDSPNQHLTLIGQYIPHRQSKYFTPNDTWKATSTYKAHERRPGRRLYQPGGL